MQGRSSAKMNFLSLDIGRRHTGVAFSDARVNVALPLDTIHHANDEELVVKVKKLVEDREVGTLIIGMPFLMDGSEGEEVEHVHQVTDLLEETCPTCSIEFVDERETSKVYNKEVSEDRNAQAATQLLGVWLTKNVG